MLGYNLKDVVSIDVDLKARHITLNLKFLSYRLYIDDDHRCAELIDKLSSFLKPVPADDKKVDMPEFYGSKKRDVP